MKKDSVRVEETDARGIDHFLWLLCGRCCSSNSGKKLAFTPHLCEISRRIYTEQIQANLEVLSAEVQPVPTRDSVGLKLTEFTLAAFSFIASIPTSIPAFLKAMMVFSAVRRNIGQSILKTIERI
jgi:hypothetical protein